MIAPSLPTELVQEIFKAASPDQAHQLAFALQAASICRQWRAIALDHTPWLWPSTLELSLRAHDERLLSALLERSRAMPLDVTILFDFHPNEAAEVLGARTTRALQLLAQHAHRMGRMSVRFTGYVPEDGAIGSAAARLVFFPSASLTALEVDIPHFVAAPRFYNGLRVALAWKTDTPGWLERYPALIHLTTNHTFWMEAETGRLAYLALRTISGQPASIHCGNFIDLLSRARNLEELILEAVQPSGVTYDLHPGVDLPALRAFTLVSPVTMGDTTHWTAARALEKLSMPALQSFTILGHSRWALSRMMASRLSYPAVTRLSFSPALLHSSRSWAHIASAFPAVQELVFLGAENSDAEPFDLVEDGMAESDWRGVHTIDVTQLVRTCKNRGDALDSIRAALGAIDDADDSGGVLRLDRTQDSRCMRDRLICLEGIRLYQ